MCEQMIATCLPASCTCVRGKAARGFSTYRLVNPTAIQGLHGPVSRTRVVVLDEAVVEALSLLLSASNRLVDIAIERVRDRWGGPQMERRCHSQGKHSRFCRE